MSRVFFPDHVIRDRLGGACSEAQWRLKTDGGERQTGHAAPLAVLITVADIIPHFLTQVSAIN